MSLALVCIIGVYHRFHYCAENWEEGVRILLRFAWWVFLMSSISLQEIEKRVWVLLWFAWWVLLINSILWRKLRRECGSCFGFYLMGVSHKFHFLCRKLRRECEAKEEGAMKWCTLSQSCKCAMVEHKVVIRFFSSTFDFSCLQFLYQ